MKKKKPMSEDKKQIFVWIKLLIVISIVLFSVVLIGKVDNQQALKRHNTENTTSTVLSAETNATVQTEETRIKTTATEERTAEIETTNHSEIKKTDIEKPVENPSHTMAEIDDDNIVYDDTDESTYLGRFYVTAYCPCWECSEGYGNITAIGTVARPNHTIGVDPDVIPYGTQVVIDGIVYTAEDTGGGANGNTIDIYFEEHWQCDNFDTGYKDVYLA